MSNIPSREEVERELKHTERNELAARILKALWEEWQGRREETKVWNSPLRQAMHAASALYEEKP